MQDAIEKPEAAIRDVIGRRNAALRAKNAAAVTACGTPDFVNYSLAPPLKATGGETGLAAWFATWEGPLGYEHRDLEIIAGDGVAFAHGLAHMSGRKTDGVVVDLWFRQTLGLRRQPDGAWKITHEHDSVPFYMDGSVRAAVDLEP